MRPAAAFSSGERLHHLGRCGLELEGKRLGDGLGCGSTAMNSGSSASRTGQVPAPRRRFLDHLRRRDFLSVLEELAWRVISAPSMCASPFSFSSPTQRSKPPSRGR
jgi:hypothetical protein